MLKSLHLKENPDLEYNAKLDRWKVAGGNNYSDHESCALTGGENPKVCEAIIKYGVAVDCEQSSCSPEGYSETVMTKEMNSYYEDTLHRERFEVSNEENIRRMKKRKCHTKKKKNKKKITSNSKSNEGMTDQGKEEREKKELIQGCCFAIKNYGLSVDCKKRCLQKWLDLNGLSKWKNKKKIIVNDKGKRTIGTAVNFPERLRSRFKYSLENKCNGTKRNISHWYIVSDIDWLLMRMERKFEVRCKFKMKDLSERRRKSIPTSSEGDSSRISAARGR
jgi:hypothetical protein